MKIRYILNIAAAAFIALMLTASCSEGAEGDDDQNSDILTGDVEIAIYPHLEVVEGAEDFSSNIYTTEKLVFYAWLTDSKEAVVTADEYRFNGVNWISTSENIYKDLTSEHTLFGYVTGSDADVADYTAIQYSQGDGDLLYTIATTKAQRETVDMDIVHAMSQLSVQFTFADYRKDETITFSLPGMDSSVTLFLTASPAVYATSNPADYSKSIDVTTDMSAATLSDIMIPQEVDQININAYDTQVTITPDAPITLEAGKRTLITINITKNELVEITMGSVSVEPWDYLDQEVTFDESIVVGQ